MTSEQEEDKICKDCGATLRIYELDNMKDRLIKKCPDCSLYYYYRRDRSGRWHLAKAVKPDFPAERQETAVKETTSLSKNMFIVHGRDAKPKLELARMLEKLGFNAIILSEQADKGRTIIEKLEEESIEAGYAFVILTPDDFGGSMIELKRASEQWERSKDIQTFESVFSRRARQNVILELGYFIGKFGRNRVCCLYQGDMELPSDIHGVLFKKFDESVEECYKGILEELKAVGYEIKI